MCEYCPADCEPCDRGTAKVNIQPPRMPDPASIDYDPKRPSMFRGLGLGFLAEMNTEFKAERQRLEDRVRQLEKRLAEAEAENDRLNKLNLGLLTQKQQPETVAEFAADDTGLYVTHIKSGKRYRVVAFDSPVWKQGSLEEQAGQFLGRKFVEAEEAEEAERYRLMVARVTRARVGLCWYPYSQDERCKLPAGHLGDHGPAHECNIDCGLADGCTLPVPTNPAAYWKAAYWELHGDSCPPTCRGHQGG